MIFWPLPKSCHSVQQAMARQWRINPTNLQVSEVAHGLVRFVFTSMEDRLWVYHTQPWAFKSAIMYLVPWEEPSPALYDRLQFMPLTVQLMDLPARCNTIKFGSKLVRPLGYKVKTPKFTEGASSK
ncbi:hypothetical protein LINGRAHAP2_LOCUS32083 [Linum grandiflorum]